MQTFGLIALFLLLELKYGSNGNNNLLKTSLHCNLENFLRNLPTLVYGTSTIVPSSVLNRSCILSSIGLIIRQMLIRFKELYSGMQNW